MPPTPPPLLLRVLFALFRRPTAFRIALNVYPPFVLAGIRCERVADDMRTVDMVLRDRWWNRTTDGLAFGGSLYAMCDPCFMLILLEGFGDDYVIWDREARMKLVREPRGELRARFHVDDEAVARVRAGLADGAPVHTQAFHAEVRDGEGRVVVMVEKVVYLRARGLYG